METTLELKEFSPKTKKVYLSIIKRLQKLKFKMPMTKNERLTYIKEFFTEHELTKASTRLDLLNLIIVLRTIKELPTIKLKEYRSDLSKERLVNQVGKMNALKEDLMTLPEFNSQLMKAFEDEHFAKFIVGYMMSQYGVRNADCNVIIVKSKKDATDPDKNYLILSKGKVTWIRNNYKTRKTFGVQTHEINDNEFVKAVKKQGVGPLFAEGQLSNAIRKLLIGGMTESKVFKMLIDDAYDKKDTVRINELSKSRGTSISTIKGFYNINAEHEIITEL